MDLRLSWLLGSDETRTRRAGAALACLAVAAIAAALILRPGPGTALVLAAVPALAAVLYAAWNGGPLLAGASAMAGLAAALVAPHPGLFAVVVAPAVLSAFVIGARHAHRAFGGPPPLGLGRKGAVLLAGWGVLVVALALAAAVAPERLLGPRVWGDPVWVPWLRTLALWAPSGAALGWAVTRRGPALCFALGSTHVWAGYLASWGSSVARTEALYLGELLLPPALQPLRATAMLGLAALAVLLAMAFEPAWPWMPYRRAAGSRQV